MVRSRQPGGRPPLSISIVERRRRGRPRSLGRYDDLADARWLGQVADPPVSPNIRISLVAVPDPYDRAGPRIGATVNRRTDILELERSRHLISEAGYQAGRIAQAVFERARGPGTSNWQGGSRVDAWTAHELAIIYALEDAAKIRAYMGWITRVLGQIDARLVRRILGDRMSYSECAALQGKSGERGISYIAQRFRDALEALADGIAARGRRK